MTAFRELLRWWAERNGDLRLATECGAWAVAVLWSVRTRTLMRRFGEVPDLSEVGWDLCPASAPGLMVVVPAKDEAETLQPAMATLLVQDYPFLRIMAIDDRSTDGTGTMLDALAAAHADRLRAMHLTETAEGWMGKTFAMQVAMERTQSEYVLFTDADVWFSPSILRRALAYAEMTGADHLVVAPTPVTKSWGERTLLGFLQLLALWATRPWRVADPRARWDAVAAGAFNLVRRSALEEIGGLAPQRLAVVEDVTLGLRMRAAGFRQRLVFAPGLVLVHWASGARGLVRGMTKNLFALTNFRIGLHVVGMAGVATLFILPLAGLFWWPTALPGLVVVSCVAVCYRILGEKSGVPARFGWLYALGALGILWAMWRSMLVTLWQGGVRWRDTFYPLRDLRAWNNPFTWEFAAAKERAELRKMRPMPRPSRWGRAVGRVRWRKVN